MAGAAEVLAAIVLEEARLTLRIRIPPMQVGRVAAGRPARLRFTAFSQRTTPEPAGTTAYIAAATRDSATGETYFAGQIAMPPGQLAALDGMLVPGMPAEVFIATGARTAMSYPVKPLTDQFQRAFRER